MVSIRSRCGEGGDGSVRALVLIGMPAGSRRVLNSSEGRCSRQRMNILIGYD